jgi:UDP-glucose 4-epimerase
MKILVTGSAGHLGEALVRTLEAAGHDVIGADRLPSPFTHAVGSIVDPRFADEVVGGAEVVLHAATLHKPHVATHSRQQFVDANVTGTLRLLEGAVAARVRAFVFTSTTSTFGDALVPPTGAPAAWITEDVVPVPKNVYGVTKTAAEDLCRLFVRNEGLPVTVLRTSRFFPEADDDPVARAELDDLNLKVIELAYRRVDLEDVVSAHLLAMERARDLGFARFVISATTPFLPEDAAQLRVDAPGVLDRRVPGWRVEFERRGWRMLPRIDRVYDNRRAREVLGWEPALDLRTAIARLAADEPPFSALAATVGSKGYHRQE